ncbi:hypothetical protein K438DRAFT_1787671 [Mycena galopus ATCC 62051]|nr:hypothetical protein K438DRAFT_1787671 [Mycena galopus ATCC 62051]
MPSDVLSLRRRPYHVPSRIQHGLKADSKAANTTKKYAEVVAAGRKWLQEYVGETKKTGKAKKGKTQQMADEDVSEGDEDASDVEEEQDPIAPDASEFKKSQDDDSSFKFDAPEYQRAFDAIPNEHSPEMLSLYLVFKIYSQGRKIGTADTTHAAFKHMWKMSDRDKYCGKWTLNKMSGAWEGNPAESAKVQDTMAAIKNKCGKDGGDRKHSLAMTEEFMTKMFYVDVMDCLVAHVTLQRKHLTFGFEDAKSFNTPYFELQLINRKGWQKRINKTQKEADLRNGKFKICAQPDFPEACDAFKRMTRWVKYLEEDIYGRTLESDDYIFPAIGANGIVQTGEHISHDNVQKWITEFAAGAHLPRANGTFSTHCCRRGGAQYRFMFAPVGRRWTLRQVRWWGGWAEGDHIVESSMGVVYFCPCALPDCNEIPLRLLLALLVTFTSGAYFNTFSHLILASLMSCSFPQRDTLIKYLLDELNTYEDDYSGMLLPAQPNSDRSFLGEASSTAPETTENITMLHQSLSADIRTLSGAFDKLLRVVGDAVTGPDASNSQPIAATRDQPLPMMGLVVPDVPVTLPSGERSRKQDSWRIIVKHWEEGDPSHGLKTPLKDWPQSWLKGVNKPLAMKHHNRKVIAVEFISRYNRDAEDFLKAYPEAIDGSSKLLQAINKARAARGDRVTRK